MQCAFAHYVLSEANKCAQWRNTILSAKRTLKSNVLPFLYQSVVFYDCEVVEFDTDWQNDCVNFGVYRWCRSRVYDLFRQQMQLIFSYLNEYTLFLQKSLFFWTGKTLYAISEFMQKNFFCAYREQIICWRSRIHYWYFITWKCQRAHFNHSWHTESQKREICIKICFTIKLNRMKTNIHSSLCFVC